MVPKGKTCGSSWSSYMSLSCHEACKRSFILKLWSWRSHGKVIEKLLKFSGYTLTGAVFTGQRILTRDGTQFLKNITVFKVYLKEIRKFIAYYADILCTVHPGVHISWDGSVSKMCISVGRQCKTVPIPGLRILVNPNQTWTFALTDIAIKVPKCKKYDTNVYNFFRFLIYFQYFKFCFHFMC